MADTIAAISTGNVVSAIGILRLSGDRAIAVADAVFVLRNAFTAWPSAWSDEPALKPNHPTQSIAAPNNTKGMFAGSLFSVLRRPKKMAPAKAAMPEEACTTMPPAKSTTPQRMNSPSGCHVMCAKGQ